MANIFDQFDQMVGGDKVSDQTLSSLVTGQAAPQRANLFDQFDIPKQADPQIGNPQELTFAEKYIAPLLPDALGNLAGGNVRGSAVGRVAQGLADPGAAIVQGAGNLIGQGDAVNQAVRDEEAKYQAARAQAGSTGFDPARLAGNVAMTSFIGAAAPGSLPERLGSFGKGVVAGAGYGLLQPVTSDGNYFAEKGKQAAIGGVTGGATSLLGSMLARVFSPHASVNSDVQLLRSEGVTPTVGQTLGGWANAMEQKAQSIPILGDAIAAARGRAREQFNNAAINRTVAPIGETVQGSGQKAIAEAGDKLSAAYNDALSGVSHVNFDTPQFNQALGQLQSMATGLRPDLAAKFDKTLSDVVLRRMSPNGSILGADLKAVDSELGKIASRFQSGVAGPSEQEFGDAIRQLQSNIMGVVGQAHPQVASAIDAADQGWANLVRVERAGAAAVNHGGVFTPAQLGNAVKASDQTVRDRATAGGKALMQDLANAGNSVIGNTVADSGTVGRALLAGGALGSAVVSPMIPAALVGGAAMYTRPVQNALTALITKRPDVAPKVANYLRQLVVPASAVTVPMLEQRFR